MFASRRPWTTISGGVGCSPGNQSAGLYGSLACARVNLRSDPGTLSGVVSGAGAAAAGAAGAAAAGAPGAGGGSTNPYAHDGCCAVACTAATARTDANPQINTPMDFRMPHLNSFKRRRL